jgi:hypothetical protein
MVISNVIDHRAQLVWSQSRLGGIQKVAFGDLDGDGGTEVACGVFQGRIKLIAAAGSAKSAHELAASGCRDIALGDGDGDGLAEIAAPANDNRIHLFTYRHPCARVLLADDQGKAIDMTLDDNWQVYATTPRYPDYPVELLRYG